MNMINTFNNHGNNENKFNINGINDIDAKNAYLVDNMSSTYYEGIKNNSSDAKICEPGSGRQDLL